MNIALLGYGVQAKAAYEYWNTPENTITICDANPEVEVPDGVETQLGPDYLKGLERFDLLVRIASLHPQDLFEATKDHPEVMERVTTVTNEFLRVCPSKNIIGVTGTKGKGTTSSLIAHMLVAAGERVHLGGNIGLPPLRMLGGDGFLNNEGTPTIQAEDWVVLELANFQLIDLKYSPKVAVCLMVEPEHLDWHTDMAEYIAAKQQLFAHQTPADTAIFYADNANSEQVASVSNGKKITYMSPPGATVEDDVITIDGQEICKTGELQLLGKHNWQNACAAVTAVWHALLPESSQKQALATALRNVLSNFSGLEHRLEFVAEVNGVKYYDDSFGTTPETAMVAIESFAQPKVLILGGSDKGASFDELAHTIAGNNVRMVILIGNTAPSIQTALQNEGIQAFVPGGDTMDLIVQTAQQYAQPGDVVLLSTACASFGLFKNYKDRGEQFHAAVQKISA